jgi:hypothetical protein
MTWKDNIRKESPLNERAGLADNEGQRIDLTPYEERVINDLQNMVSSINSFLSSSPRLVESQHLKSIEDNLSKVLVAIERFNTSQYV